jgi:hypothetical protein
MRPLRRRTRVEGKVDMGEEQAPQKGFPGFLTTVPGILTAAAAVITAVGAIYLGIHNASATPGPIPTPTVTVNLKVTGGEPPSPAGPVDRQSLRLEDVSGLSADDPVARLIAACAHDSDAACLQILEILAQDCSAGDGLSCDVLFEVSPIGSVYEAFGATCGDRYPANYADRCSDL